MSGRYAKNYGEHWRTRAKEVSLAAEGLNARGESYCADVQSDGFVDDMFLAALCGGKVDKRALEELVKAGWWERVEGGHVIVGYLDRNISKNDDAKRRAGIAARTAKSRTKSRDSDASQNASRNDHGNDACNALHDASPLTQSIGERPKTQDPDPPVAPQGASGDAEGRVIAMHRPKRTRCQLMAALARLHSERVKRISGKPGPMPPSVVDALERGEQSARYALTLEHLERLAEWAEQDESPEALFGQVLDGAERDTWMREKALPLKSLAENPSRYVTTVGGRAEPLPNSAYQGTTEAEADAMFGPRDEKAIAAIGRRRVV